MSLSLSHTLSTSESVESKQATMLKKNKLKMKRRNTEPTMMVAGSAAPPLSLALPPSVGEVGLAGGEGGAGAGLGADGDGGGGTNNTDF